MNLPILKLYFLCERNCEVIHMFNDKYLCEFCIEITYGLITDNRGTLLSTSDERILSLLFTSEK